MKKITAIEARGLDGKRIFRKVTIGKKVPVKANTAKKKNNQRGPIVGKVKRIRNKSPPQPVPAKPTAATMLSDSLRGFTVSTTGFSEVVITFFQ